ncbi:hypothetical protein BHF71_04820 [Vulcanibacillus modesticaldus]|uniref:Alkaline shock response membrane anchor protein AmaP n=1 Tax=Vulcanibacillus modesticaldus TaxID=337097 RepID=A0A1D2YRU4_9BACI|nr:alkaline shock response membrane anchor protein AmaP [Vulcanibacillus modesticaldus]OEF95517.1 hypothetical protein BHF71_04820 [Vulcanibacillus modesticaldus]
MRILERVFLLLYSLLFMLLALFTLLFIFRLIKYDLILGVIDLLYYQSNGKLIAMIVSILIILFSIYLISRGLRTKRAISFSSKRTEIGDIKISLDTLETLTSKVSSKVKGVKEQKPKVKIEDDGSVSIIVKILVDGETPIPQITNELQLNVKHNLEQVTGISVNQVHVLVANISQSSIRKARVE